MTRDASRSLRLLTAELESWAGTPWIEGQSCKGRHGGVDCVRLVDAVLCSVHDAPATNLPRFPPDSALHSPKAFGLVAREWFKKFPARRVPPSLAIPGSVLLVSQTKRPTHVAIVDMLGRVWHAPREHGEVRYTSVQALSVNGARVVKAWLCEVFA